ncbi:MAG TPA: phosphopantetheine-binding protein [Ureibacillus sp.]|nr:phosphopantetheine-binding protein [Ureibacillus sp.]
MTKEQLRELLSRFLEEMETIADDENLEYAGLDSMMMMSIVEQLRAQDILVNFLELAEEPTIEAWIEKIHKHMTV